MTKKKEWEFGVPVLHGDEALREDFYKVTKDLTDAACIVDIWINDIQKTLEKHGYEMKVYLK